MGTEEGSKSNVNMRSQRTHEQEQQATKLPAGPDSGKRCYEELSQILRFFSTIPRIKDNIRDAFLFGHQCLFQFRARLLGIGLLLSLFLSLTINPALRAQTIRRVKEMPGAGTPDGSTWAKAITLAAALKASASGDEVWIAAGTYKPHASTRTISFTVKAGVKVYGGFAGTETSKDERDPIANPTILSGDIGTTGTHTDNSYHVATITGNDAELHGLTITRGRANSRASNRDKGAGLYVGGAHTGIVLSHCTFTHNNSTDNGAGAHFAASSTATLNHCTLTNNTSEGSGGGAIFFGTATLNHCTFFNNTAASRGGGAYFSSTATLLDCVFAGNTASGNETFIEGGGGAYFGAGATVTNCTFYKNTAVSLGGGLRAEAEGFKLYNSIFVGNTASSSTPSGSSGNGPQVWVKAVSTASKIDYCLIAGGSAGFGRPSSASGIPTNAVSSTASAAEIFASVAEAQPTYLRLRPNSAAVNAGLDSHYTGLDTTSKDLDGNARKVGTQIDLGAYELYEDFRIEADKDGDGLIEIHSLADLNNMRYDLAGSSYKKHAGAVGLTTGCPTGGCEGYELTMDLDFRAGCRAVGTAASACDYSDWVPQDSSGNIAAPANGTNAGWVPIESVGSDPFECTFEGNGYAIYNLYVNLEVDEGVEAGLFGYVNAGIISNVGLTGEHMFVSASTTSGDASVGSLAGDVDGSTIRNCYATGDVSATTTDSGAQTNVGGLVGKPGSITMVSNCYATGDVVAVSAGNLYAGGLAGNFQVATMENCYATGDLEVTGSYVLAGRLAGYVSSSTITKSYRLSTATVSGGAPNSEGEAKTAAELKALTASSSGWSEQNWDFGPASQLPLLRTYREVGEGNQVQGTPIAGQPFVVDDDGDGLIEIASLAQLNHIRFDLAGTSYKTSATDSGTTKGCPDKDHDNSDSTPKQPTCHGYELTKNLDFTDIDAVGYQADWDPTDSDAANNAGWEPIGDLTNAFTGTFEGNGYAIYNLYVNHTPSSLNSYAGLFGGAKGAILQNVGLTGEHMSVAIRAGSGVNGGGAYAGGLVGYSKNATTRNCYATGSVVATARGASSGGLVGYADGATLIDCYATGNVKATGSIFFAYSGGLVGGILTTTLNNCYATGDVSSDYLGNSAKHSGGLVGDVSGRNTITNSYRLSTATVSGGTPNSEGIAKTAAELKALTATRTSWSELNWDFGTNEDYPLLRAYATDDNGNQQLTSLLEGQDSRPAEEDTSAFDAADSVVDDDGDGLIEIWNLTQLNHIRHNLAGTSYKTSASDGGSAMGCPEKGSPAKPTCHGYELMADLDFTDSNATGYDEDWDPVVQKAKETPGAGWTPIGGTFTGTFEGNGHTIGNLYVNVSSSSDFRRENVGLFQYLGSTAILRNVGLIGEYMSIKVVTTGDSSSGVAGGLAGGASGSRISNCYAAGTIVSTTSQSSSFSGGLVGDIESGVTLTNCYTTGNVLSSTSGNSFRSYAGGLVGLAQSGDITTNCYSTGNMTSTATNANNAHAGGLIARGGTVNKSYYSGVVKKGTSSSLGSAIQTSGQYKTEAALRLPEAAVGIYAAWSAKDWVFGTKGQLPALLTYETNDGGSQVKGRLINGQSRAHARRAAALPTPKYALSHSTKTSFTLEGASVPSGLVRRVFVHTSTLSGLSIPSMADAAGDAGSGATIHFDLATGEGESLVIGAGGTYSDAAALRANTKYFVRIYDYRMSDHVVSKVSPELAVWTAPLDPSAYTAGMHTTNSFVLTGKAVPAGLTRRFFLSTSTLAALGVERGRVVDAPGSGLSTFELSVGEGASVKVGTGGTYSGAAALNANTNYFVRVMDYRASGVSSGILPEVSVWTLPAVPSGYEASTKTDTSVSFSDGGAVPDGLTRRYFRSTSGSVSFPGGTPMVGGAGTVEELTGVTNAASVTFGGLAANTEYYFYFVDSRSSPALVSAHLRRGPIRTTEAPDPDAPEKPIYTVGDEVTTTTISLTKVDGMADASRTLTRRFFLSTNELDLTEAQRGGSGLPQGVTTFVVNGAGAIVLGSGSPAANGSLLPNTKYFVYVSDYNTETRKVSLAHDITGGSGAWTKPLAPTGYRVSGITENSVTFSRGGAVPQNITRRYFRSTSGSLMFANGAPSANAQGTFTELTGVADAASVTFGGLTAGTEYHFYFADYNAESRFGAVLKLEATPEQGAVIPPAYSVGDGVTTTTIPLTKASGTADASPTLVRRFFLATSELDLSETQRDGADLPDGVTTFTVNAAGAVVLGSGSPTRNASLMPNTNYFVYATDWNRQSGKVSTARDIAGDSGAWTLPEAVQITVPTVTSGTATTGSVEVAGNTKVHWVLLKESAVSTSDLTGANIKGATKGSNIVSARRVLNKGTLSASGTIALHAGITLSTGAHVVYYVVEGTSSGSFSAVQGVSFSVPGASAGTIPAPSYTVGTPTQTTIPLTEGSAFQNGADRRRFFVSKSDLAQLEVRDVKMGTHSGAEGEVWTFVLSENTDSVTIGSGTPEANNRLEPNTNYFVRAVDYNDSTGGKSALSANLSGTTAKTPKIAFGAHKPKVYAYPNPTSGLLHVPVPSGVALVYGSDGSEVGSFEVAAGQMDLTGLPAGSYILRLKGAAVRVVKRHR